MAAAVLGALALSLAAGHAALAANAGVAMRGAQFVPASVTVNVGDSVTWTNEDGIAHSARADNGSFDTGIFSTGSRSVTFSQAGTFGYFCAVHPTTMRGTVNVAGAATAPPTPAPPTPAPPTPPPPTPQPATAPPATARPSPAAPTVVPSTPSATASPAASPGPSAAPAGTEAPTATPTPLAAQASPTPTQGSSRTGDDGQQLPIVALLAGAIVLTGVAIWAIRRG